MLVKKFEASSLEKALALVKQELGPNALILSSNQVHRRWFQRPIVEVTAAFERKAQKDPTEFDEKALMEVFPHRRYEDVPVPKVEKEKPVNRYVDDKVDKEPGRKAQLPGRKVTDDKFENFFLAKGFSKETSRELSRKLVVEYPSTELSNPAFLSRVREKLLTPTIRVYGKEKIASRTSWVAVGPAGAGKTTLLVKLALWGKEQGRPVCLVSQDRKKASGAHELANYARILRVPFAVETSKISGKQLLIDTAAMRPGDEEHAKECERVCEGRSTVLVLDATMRLTEMLRTLEATSRLSLAAVAFTKCDLAHELGVIPEVISASRLPLFGMSMTDSFREPFSFPEADELARRVFAKEAA